MDSLRYALFYSRLSQKIAAVGCFLMAILFAVVGWRCSDTFLILASLFMAVLAVSAGRRLRR